MTKPREQWHKEILSIVEAEPGIHIQGIADKLINSEGAVGVSRITARMYIGELHSAGKIRELEKGALKEYFIV